MTRPTILFFVSTDHYFCSHRMDLACAARDGGYRIVVVTEVNTSADRILREGFELIPIVLKRNSLNLITAVKNIVYLSRIYRTTSPAIVHHVGIKPILLGGIAAYRAGGIKIVHVLTGLGFVFTSNKFLAECLRPFVKLLYRWLFRQSNSCVIFQNSDDKMLFEQSIVRPSKSVLIRGSGVDTSKFKPISAFLSEDAGMTVTVVSRMLADKGIYDVIEAARILKLKKIPVHIQLIGSPDEGNPATITMVELRRWHDEGIVQWRGYCEDIIEVWLNSHVALLPSLREGLPKSLLEAASTGRAIITTDVPGCREVVIHGINGLLVPPKSPESIANAIIQLRDNLPWRLSMGKNGRERVMEYFDVKIVVEQTLSLYKELLTC